jgi:TatA/E family protein of Tat protein translocase
VREGSHPGGVFLIPAAGAARFQGGLRELDRRAGRFPSRRVREMFGMQPMHWLIVALVVLLVYGPKRLPEMAKSLGEGLKEFKKVLHQEDEKQEGLPGTEEKQS